MSYTTLKAIWPGERVEDICDLRNGWGSSPVIWEVLGKRYCHFDESKNESWLFPKPNAQKVWDLWMRPDLATYIRAVLLMTFDLAYVVKTDYGRAAHDIRQFLKTMPIGKNVVNHWPTLAELFESNPDYPAIGFHATSVAEDIWSIKYDETTGIAQPADWGKTFDVYASLDALLAEESKGLVKVTDA